jgi:hypothetical protein
MSKEEMKRTDKQKLKEAIKLLEEVHYYIHDSCSFANGKLSMGHNKLLRNKVPRFVKSVKKKSKLQLDKINYTPCMAA